jgi:hypothetical protein
VLPVSCESPMAIQQLSGGWNIFYAHCALVRTLPFPIFTYGPHWQGDCDMINADYILCESVHTKNKRLHEQLAISKTPFYVPNMCSVKVHLVHTKSKATPSTPYRKPLNTRHVQINTVGGLYTSNQTAEMSRDVMDEFLS